MVRIDREGGNVQEAVHSNSSTAHRRHQLADIFDKLLLGKLRQGRTGQGYRLHDRAIDPDDTGYRQIHYKYPMDFADPVLPEGAVSRPHGGRIARP